MRTRTSLSRLRMRTVCKLFFLCASLIVVVTGYTHTQALAHSPGARSTASMSAEQAFSNASQRYGVPIELLKSICYMEGRLSNHGGSPSIDNGFGCMHLVRNANGDTLDLAAQTLKVSTTQLKNDLATNILGGAAILHEEALQLSPTRTLPPDLAHWYGAIAAYSNATVRSTALMYADSVYKLLNQGFRAQTDQGEMVTLAPQKIVPVTGNVSSPKAAASVPTGCTNDKNVDYPGAVDCVLNPQTFDCNITPTTACNFTGANRSTSDTLDEIVIHDVEGTAQNALNVFQNPDSQASAHYIVDSDGTVYQVVREHDIAYHGGNFWYNSHSIGIENAGFDANGYQWYNATEYLASAKLVAYLLQKYHLPLDREHVISHGTIPSPTLAASPNHVDPGPYWLWDYYFKLISQQGMPLDQSAPTGTITLHPHSDQRPLGQNGRETQANFSFFSLYRGPSTRSGLIPQQGNGNDITDVSFNVEPGVAYAYLTKKKDAAGTGDTMYQIWYGEEDRVHTSKPSYFADAQLAWLAVRHGDGIEGNDSSSNSPVLLSIVSPNGGPAQIYGQPVSKSENVIGAAPAGAAFVTYYTVMEDGTNNLWYEIEYNHRQAWVPVSETSFTAQALSPEATEDLSHP